MSRIVTNVQSQIAQRVLGTQNKELNQALTRLSTGLQINSGKDDPAGLIASETLRSEKVAINSAVENARRADTMLSVAEGALVEVNRLLLELEDLIDNSANSSALSDEEVSANQDQIDSILQSINRIANSTEFADKKLLAGEFEFTTSGVSNSDLTNVKVNSAKLAEGTSRQVTIEVVSGSQFASVSGVGGGTSGALSTATTLEVTGRNGTEVFSFASGTTAQTIVDSINSSTELTGVSATMSGSGGIFFTSDTYGSDAMVSVEVLRGGFTLSSNNDTGTDGTIIVNGTQAQVKGLDVHVRTGVLNGDFRLSDTFATTDGGSTAFELTGGGASFSIAPEVSMTGIETIGIDSVSTGSLGNFDDGFLESLTSGSTNDLASANFSSAQRIVHAAQEQVSSLRGRIGAFQKNTLTTAVNSLLVAYENTSAAESAIRETDFANTTSELTRAQILVNSATSTLQLANAQPQSVLSLLG